MNPTKTCIRCGIMKTVIEFTNDKSENDGKCVYCKMCIKEKYQDNREKIAKRRKIIYENGGRQKRKNYYENGGRQKQGHVSMYENKSCSSYLGVVIGERLCRFLFKDVETMPYGSPGYDIICNKGKKINIKTKCIVLKQEKIRWIFSIRQNKIADYFILIAFDNVKDLNPLYMWMIPGYEVNNQISVSISLSMIHKWDKWKMNINDAQLCCTEMKGK